MNQPELNKPSNYPRIDISTGDFKDFRLRSDVLVDKSKSLNLSMLKYFFEIETDTRGNPLPPNEKTNHILFTGGEMEGGIEGSKVLEPLKVSTDKSAMDQQGKYPVIFLDLKDVKGGSSYQEVENKIKIQIFNAFVEHNYLKQYLVPSDDILENTLEKEQLIRCFLGKPEKADLEVSLKLLSKFLYQHFNQKVYLLIDEYDTVINDAFLELKPKEFDKVLKLFRTMLGSVLKGNVYLEKAVLTGILRIAKANLFSDLNNVKEYNLLDKKFTEYYGFTQEEFGGQTVYNPLSVMCCLEEKDSGGTDLVEQAILSDENQLDLQNLLKGRNITKKLYKQIALDQIKKDKRAFYSLLVFAGYLNPVETEVGYKLSIPNQEVREIYEERVVAGSFQLAKNIAEIFYSGLMLGISSDLSPTYFIASEAEVGEGRGDLTLLPKSPRSTQAFILEYKVCKNEKQLKAKAKKGLEQIEKNHYDAQAKQHPQVKKITKLALAFWKKKLALEYKIEERVSDDV
ncbi:17100_t:CDS:2 [Racocetra fulgida]|uniref:17100_t:CDS:1 n=1 Tax=Racocetra fulgida TaxID=60492 RepID=A0A9N9GZS7_9GLOM|nr:17100_t:CDS:2 [Racocetra fulgida]